MRGKKPKKCKVLIFYLIPSGHTAIKHAKEISIFLQQKIRKLDSSLLTSLLSNIMKQKG